MASSSNGAQVGVEAVPKMSAFHVDQGLADDTALPSQIFDAINLDLEDDDPTYPSTIVTLATDFLENRQDGNLASATSAFGQLVKGAAQKVELELAALKVIFPKAKVEDLRITTSHYVVVMKKFLRDLLESETGIRGVPYRKEYALLLSRLGGALGSYCFDADSLLDPANVAGCLGEMLTDMEETWKILLKENSELKELREAWGPDVEVYVRRASDNYAQCLLDAADVLNQC